MLWVPITFCMITCILKQILKLLCHIFRSPKKQSDLVLENLALRQQLSIYHYTMRQPKIRARHRIFWIALSKVWKEWRNALIFVKQDTVIHWHKKGFKLFWRLKSRKRGPGRPRLESKTKRLIEDMAKANPLWGAPRIHGELIKLGIDCVSERTISNIIKKCRPPKPPSQSWRTFLKNPWQNPYVERLICSIRRDCLDPIIALNSDHLKRILDEYIDYYHNDRTHLGIEKETPFGRPTQLRPKKGKLIKFPPS